MKRIILISLLILANNLLSSIIEPAKIEFINGRIIEGKIVKYDEGKLYFSFNDRLYIIDRALLKNLYYKDKLIEVNKLSLIKYDRLLWSDYIDHININDIRSLSFDPERLSASLNNKLIDNSETLLIFKSGQSMKEFSTYCYVGLSVTIIGCIVTIASQKSDVRSIGIGITLVGSLISLMAPYKMNNAGDYLINLSKLKSDSTSLESKHIKTNDNIK